MPSFTDIPPNVFVLGRQLHFFFADICRTWLFSKKHRTGGPGMGWLLDREDLLGWFHNVPYPLVRKMLLIFGQVWPDHSWTPYISSTSPFPCNNFLLDMYITRRLPCRINELHNQPSNSSTRLVILFYGLGFGFLQAFLIVSLLQAYQKPIKTTTNKTPEKSNTFAKTIQSISHSAKKKNI